MIPHRLMSIALGLVFVCLMTLPAAALDLPQAAGTEVAMSRSQWRLFVPDGYRHRANGEVDLLVHFHGDPTTVRNNAAYAGVNAVVVTVNYNGLSSAYRTPFEDPTLFQQLLNDATNRLGAQPGFDTPVWDTLAVSSFSAGYGAVREMLKNPAYVAAIDSVLAADSLYATTGFDGRPLASQMQGYYAFADLAAANDKRFVFTHSDVPTFTYESTRETGDAILGHLGLAAAAASEPGLGPLQRTRGAERGGFSLWGAAGATGDDHLNHLRYMAEWLDELGLDAAPAPGDFNRDGTVDGADYTMWRDNDGGAFRRGDYRTWLANFGRTSAAVEAGVASTVPEPHAALLVAMSAAAMARGPGRSLTSTERR